MGGKKLTYVFSLKKSNHFIDFFFRSRGVYNVHAFAFDIRHYTEIFVPVTIFRIPCTNPQVFLPKNQTSFAKMDLIPSYKISDSFKNQAVVSIQCNETMATSTEWKIYQVELVKSESEDTESDLKPVLHLLEINDTIPTYQSTLMIVPPRILTSGLHKLVFKFEVCKYF